MIEVFLVILACQAPDYSKCVWLDTVEMPNQVLCQLRRPTAAMAFQLDMPDGWLTFTRCDFTNPETEETP